MSRAKLIDYYLEKSLTDDFQIDQIRKELEAKNIEDEEIKVIVRLVDNEMQKKALTKSSNQKSNELVYIGLALTIIGVGITVGTYTGLINTGNSFIIAYGPFFAGVSILLTGLAKSNSSSKKISSRIKK
jgi:hypothetical protein